MKKTGFRNIGLIGRLGSNKVVETLKRLMRFLGERNYHVIVEEQIGRASCRERV